MTQEHLFLVISYRRFSCQCCFFLEKKKQKLQKLLQNYSHFSETSCFLTLTRWLSGQNELQGELQYNAFLKRCYTSDNQDVETTLLTFYVKGSSEKYFYSNKLIF